MKLETRIAIIAVCLAIAGQAAGQTNQQSAILSRTTLPSEITLNDGSTYKSVTLIRVDPDGLFAKYKPEQGGEGMAKLKFKNLPEAIQKQFDYSPEQATEHETRQEEGTLRWAAWQSAQDERGRKMLLEREARDMKIAERMDVEQIRAETMRREAQARIKEAEAARKEAEALALRSSPQINIVNQTISERQPITYNTYRRQNGSTTYGSDGTIYNTYGR